jgi:arylsulfatase A-like enzyme
VLYLKVQLFEAQIKATELEGGTRLAAAIWSPLIKHKQRVSDAMMHMVDVLPTLCSAAGMFHAILHSHCCQPGGKSHLVVTRL